MGKGAGRLVGGHEGNEIRILACLVKWNDYLASDGTPDP